MAHIDVTQLTPPQSGIINLANENVRNRVLRYDCGTRNDVEKSRNFARAWSEILITNHIPGSAIIGVGEYSIAPGTTDGIVLSTVSSIIPIT